jgi:hypothetical protein
MADEQKQSTADIAGQISSFIEKNGISTLLLVAVAYVGYTSFLKPAGERYVEMIAAVTESNVSLTATIDDLRQGLRDVGEANQKTLGETSVHLNNIDQKLDDIQEISRDIDRKLDLLRRPSYLPEKQEDPDPEL